MSGKKRDAPPPVDWGAGDASNVQAMALRWLAATLAVERAFPWQEALLARLLGGDCPRAIDIPTGLGKTAVIAIWLVARACGAALPRRLVYVVDRRAVVDQATDVAMKLRAFVDRDAAFRAALSLDERDHLAISTLRGQFADNRDWLADPATTAIILGTVDMIGSRLLFEGYGATRRMRPYQAGLLGADTLIALDEAHLVPPFQRLVEAIADGVEVFGPSEITRRKVVPPLRLVALSATGDDRVEVFRLTPADHQHPLVRKRLDARKRLIIRTPIDPTTTKVAAALVDEVWELSDRGRRAARYVVYCDRRDDASKVHAALQERAAVGTAEGPEIETELFVGGRRVFERQKAAERLGALGYLADRPVAACQATFLVATSAGEVGVDLDADDMVSDLVPWERMVQRLGRVNRRGDGDATVIVIPALPDKATVEAVEAVAKAKAPSPDDDDDETDDEAGEAEAASSRADKKHKVKPEQWRLVRSRRVLDAVALALARLPALEGGHDASPGAIADLKRQAAGLGELAELLANATTPPPLFPGLTRPLVEAWSMTSLREHHGRPEVQPWVRGWTDDEPQTTIVWRTHLPLRNGTLLPRAELADFLEAAPPHTLERLETETWRVVSWLLARAEAITRRLQAEDTRVVEDDGERPDESPAATLPLEMDEVTALILPGSGTPTVRDLRGLARIAASKDKRDRETLERELTGATLVVDVRLGGLLPTGLIDEDTYEASDVGDAGALPFRVRSTTDAKDAAMTNDAWREELRIPSATDDDGQATRWLVVESSVAEQPATEDGRSTAPRAQLLAEHEEWAERHARGLAERLGLPQPWAALLALAARLHDEGKKARRWQMAFRAPPGGPWGKTTSRPSQALLDGYRHELGSLPIAEQDPRVRDLDPERRDLLLHLIAAHHGHARPLISTSGCEDAPRDAIASRAQVVALRFAAMERRWGPWGLVWWEALLRAADQQASRENDERGAERG